jgi:hypothetical protein
MELVNTVPTPMWIVWFLLIVAIWVTPWKGVALWRAGGNKQLVWFICLLIFNTLAILEIIYIFGFSKKKK